MLVTRYRIVRYPTKARAKKKRIAIMMPVRDIVP
jgi:hypothetical protein